MSWLQNNFTTLLVAVLLVALVLDIVAKLLQARVRKLTKERDDLRAAKARIDSVHEAAHAWATAIQSKANTDGWFALPGGKRIEFRATGFYIELEPHSKQGPYALSTPEGACIAFGHNLSGLKTLGRIAATEREEFSSWGKDYLP